MVEGRGVSLSVASVISASVPSEPIRRRVRSYPVDPLLVYVPQQNPSPVPATARRPSVFSRGVPYLTARGPAALQARLPPMLHQGEELGSGGQKSPCGASARCR